MFLIKEPFRQIFLGGIAHIRDEYLHFENASFCLSSCNFTVKKGTVSDIQFKIAGEERPAPEGVWVQGGRIELPAIFFYLWSQEKQGKS